MDYLAWIQGLDPHGLIHKPCYIAFMLWCQLCHYGCWDIWLSFWSWWRHQMETFSALLAICAGNSPVPGEFPTQTPVTRSFDVYFDLRLNKRLSKQPWGWWFETPSWSLWRQCNDKLITCECTYFSCAQMVQRAPDISQSLFSKLLTRDTHSSTVRVSGNSVEPCG